MERYVDDHKSKEKGYRDLLVTWSRGPRWRYRDLYTYPTPRFIPSKYRGYVHRSDEGTGKFCSVLTKNRDTPLPCYGRYRQLVPTNCVCVRRNSKYESCGGTSHKREGLFTDDERPRDETDDLVSRNDTRKGK